MKKLLETSAIVNLIHICTVFLSNYYDSLIFNSYLFLKILTKFEPYDLSV